MSPIVFLAVCICTYLYIKKVSTVYYFSTVFSFMGQGDPYNVSKVAKTETMRDANKYKWVEGGSLFLCVSKKNCSNPFTVVPF